MVDEVEDLEEEEEGDGESLFGDDMVKLVRAFCAVSVLLFSLGGWD